MPASLGGLTAELFTRRHPDQVAGLVFVDAGNSAILEFVVKRVNWMEVESVCLAKTAARFGVLRLLNPLGLRSAAGEARLYRVEPMGTLCGVARGRATTAQEMAAAPPFPPDIPLTVLVHEKPDGLFPPGLSSLGEPLERAWLGLQQQFARQSQRGTWRVAPGSNHLIGNSRPHAVASAVIEMLAQLRGGR